MKKIAFLLVLFMSCFVSQVEAKGVLLEDIVEFTGPALEDIVFFEADLLKVRCQDLFYDFENNANVSLETKEKCSNIWAEERLFVLTALEEITLKNEADLLSSFK